MTVLSLRTKFTLLGRNDRFVKAVQIFLYCMRVMETRWWRSLNLARQKTYDTFGQTLV